MALGSYFWFDNDDNGIGGVCFIRILVTYLAQFLQPAQT